MRVLIVEDDLDLAETLVDGLRSEGYLVEHASDGARALSRIAATDVDLVILDRDLPVIDGDSVCRAMVAMSHPARILMLTAAGSLADRVDGLDLGADDYLSKPFAYVELVARLRALKRRDDPVIRRVLEVGGVRLDPTRRIAERDGRPLQLTEKEFGVLEALLAADGGYMGITDLLDEVWDNPVQRSRSVVKVTVNSLRAKLGNPPVIASEAGHGYRIEGL